jgi:hypothetical protein
VCNESAACIGLSSHNKLNNRAHSIVEQHVDPHRFMSYLFPSLNKNMAYRLFDMSWNELIMDPTPSPFNQPATLKQACTEIYDQASRTGATKHFWEAHQRQGKAIISGHGKSDAWISAQLVLAMHVVFQKIFVVIGDTGKVRTFMAALLPICLPHSSYHGSFFWLCSSTTADDALTSHQEMLAYITETSYGRVIDLTLEQ